MKALAVSWSVGESERLRECMLHTILFTLAANPQEEWAHLIPQLGDTVTCQINSSSSVQVAMSEMHTFSESWAPDLLIPKSACCSVLACDALQMINWEHWHYYQPCLVWLVMLCIVLTRKFWRLDVTDIVYQSATQLKGLPGLWVRVMSLYIKGCRVCIYTPASDCIWSTGCVCFIWMCTDQSEYSDRDDEIRSPCIIRMLGLDMRDFEVTLCTDTT